MLLPSAVGTPPRFFGLSRDQLAERLETLGVPRYRANQLYSWVYRKRQRESEAMTDLPRALRHRIGEVCSLELARRVTVRSTADDLTHKFVLELEGGGRVEAVSMRTERRLTFCI